MLKWKVMSGEEKYNVKKQDMKAGFDAWFSYFWENKCDKETMLSPQSPLPHVYAIMCLSAEEGKKICPSNYYETCSSCGNDVETWIETGFSFCSEYGCGMSLCIDCAKKLKEQISELERRCE